MNSSPSDTLKVRGRFITMVEIKRAKAHNGKERIYVTTPYHPTMVNRARELNGTWHAESKYWSFDARDEETIRALCITLYGTDGSPVEEPLVTVLAQLTDDTRDLLEATDSLFLCGREIAWRKSRDYAVRLGEGVVIRSGGFPGSGGSARYPLLCPLLNTVLEVRDVPESLAIAEIARLPKVLSLAEVSVG